MKYESYIYKEKNFFSIFFTQLIELLFSIIDINRYCMVIDLIKKYLTEIGMNANVFFYFSKDPKILCRRSLL